MVALTRTTYIPRRATLYVSYDSGASFQNVVEKNIHCLCFTYPNGTRVDADIDRFYHAPQKTYTSAVSFFRPVVAFRVKKVSRKEIDRALVKRVDFG